MGRLDELSACNDNCRAAKEPSVTDRKIIEVPSDSLFMVAVIDYAQVEELQ